MTKEAQEPGNALAQPEILIGATNALHFEIDYISHEIDDIGMATEIIHDQVGTVEDTDEVQVVRWHVEYLTYCIQSHLDNLRKRLDRIRVLMPEEATS